jgi:chloramphenicol O-acetyltransferase type A
MIKSSPIPARYQAEPLSDDFKEGWLAWSLDFFTQPTQQVPYLDITLQLDVTEAYRCYEMEKERGSGEGVTFFSFLVWHLSQTLANHPSFNLRWVGGIWYLLKNPPIFIPVAVGGKLRFSEMVLEDVYNQDYGTFIENYTRLLNQARNGGFQEVASSSVFHLAHFMGNIPYLRFSGLTLHWRAEQMIG